ncbi:hypothetical protein AtubIFM55763_008282 [Aspergillus tubingensis]|uniref:Uncharacterized protein n=1 Tax=Aspergillus tubingensis TaxID=5068 RepID=A0A8H3SRJ5_ASPTU|nr:DUF221 domain protein [Aspergillus tubingensis]GFN14546.1 DUF221 domain protein [Aspergillus tubingensis]GLA69101.1 hypothetical protein AtubIFM55763_008282 [Aspergillus tubingensis]GLA87884.1 hypothetical protein AtubIFM56815_002317 [Aspergillus tubingensis]GLA97666.1 hypothetical protein AtubIFM57143_005594 [Aspergillus tubingensis]GLB09771.1 hypothetical protein AtubIFM57258_005699 [Aspergillus tubingensis]
MHPSALQQRDDPTEQFLKLISNPFSSAFQVNAIWASLATSAGFSILLALLFSLFRPRHSVVYAPKVKHADNKHTPPPVGRGFFAWLKPVLRTKEPALVDCIGLDATMFVRFTKMCRNIFIFLSIIGCGLMIPLNLTQSTGDTVSQYGAFSTMTVLYVTSDAIWGQVICAWAFDAIIAFFLWRNYKGVLALRRKYFESPEYQRSLHARTLMITDIPPAARGDEGVLRLTDEVNPTAAVPRASIGRNVKGLPRLIKEHDETVRELEAVLAKYLKHPDRLPPKRPTMRPPRKERGEHTNGRVDAIDYLTDKIKRLEEEIKHVRSSIDRRNAMPFGFVSWDMIEHAHAVAYTARKKHPEGTTIVLAPRPDDLIWENLPLSKAARKWKRFLSAIWVSVLTLVYVVPNGLIAIFLSNLNNLASVWPAFRTSMDNSPYIWAAVQGILSPAVTSLVYIVLPIIFRRLAIRAGDVTKTSRERHVLNKLYTFFVFNNLIVFSLFSAAWTFVSAVIDAERSDENAWQAIKDGKLYIKIVNALCQVSPFWVTYLLQRNLGATIDLIQLVSVFWVWFSKTFLSPTPRQAIEWTAPPAFDYASYYNYFLFYATVALCFATLQPIVLPVTALYFGLDAMMKKYMLLYVFVTKTESGGQFWRVLFNRMLFAVILSNIIIIIVATAKGTWTMVYCVIPPPLLMLGFKFYCMRKFDDDITFYNRANLTDAEALAVSKPNKKASERLNSKFGHPALYKPLITPMVHAKAAEALKRIYSGRLGTFEGEGEYSDIAMDAMSSSHPGKSMMDDANAAAPFEVVPENHLDFSYYKNRPDFRDEFGGGIYGRPDDLMTERSHTPASALGEWSPTSSRASSPAPSLPSSLSGLKPHDAYDPTLNDHIHPAFRVPAPMNGGLYQQRNESETELLHHAQGPAVNETVTPLDRWRTRGYGPVEQDDPSFTSYEHYRMPR